jgi:hypothetical protein
MNTAARSVARDHAASAITKSATTRGVQRSALFPVTLLLNPKWKTPTEEETPRSA